MTACAWALLDVVVACVCDATATVIDMVHQPLSTFLAAALRCAGANADSSSRVHANDQQSASIGDTPVARNGATAGGGGGSSHSPRHLPPCGLHPATLHRLLMTALTAHTFAHQKREYARVGWQWCLDMGVAKDAEVFFQRMLQARQLGRVAATSGHPYRPLLRRVNAGPPPGCHAHAAAAGDDPRRRYRIGEGCVAAFLFFSTNPAYHPLILLPSHWQTSRWTAASRSPPSCSATTPPRPPSRRTSAPCRPWRASWRSGATTAWGGRAMGGSSSGAGPRATRTSR